MFRSTLRQPHSPSVRAAAVPMVIVCGMVAACHDEDDVLAPLPVDRAGCIGEPVASALVDGPAHVTLKGYAPASATRADLQAKNHDGEVYVTLSGTPIGEAGVVQSCGTAAGWTPFSVDFSLPFDRRFYAATGPDDAIVLRMAMLDANGDTLGYAATFDAGSGACAPQPKSDGAECLGDPIDAHATAASPELTLVVRCGATGGLCCAPWDFAHAQALAYGTACTGSNAAACDSCREPGALCDQHFTCSTGLWPSDSSAYTPNITDPSAEISQPWTYDVQGVATDGTYWYFTQGSKGAVDGALHRVPMAANLDQSFSPAPAGVTNLTMMPDPNCPHWGDPEIWKGRVYIPMEECADGANRMMEVDAASLKPLATTKLEPDINAPSVAIHPDTGEFYMAGPYDGQTNTNVLRVYEVAPSSQTTAFSMTRDREVSVVDTDGVSPLPLHEVQGLAISPSGKLYISAQGSTQNIYCLELSPDKATLMYRVFVEMHEDQASDQEYEGMAVFDAGSAMGQIHLFTYQNFRFIDHPYQGAWFKHVAVSGIDLHPNWY